MTTTHHHIYRELIIRPRVPWITPLQADTIMGHVFWRIKQTMGGVELEKFLTKMKGRPVCTISDAMPEGLLYRPVLLGTMPTQSADFDAAKRFAGTQYIPDYALGDRTCLVNHPKAASRGSRFDDKWVWKNQINRQTGKVDDTGGLYIIPTTMTKNRADHSNSQTEEDYGCLRILMDVFDIDTYREYDIERKVADVLRDGFGKKKSTGYGIFDIKRDWQGWHAPVQKGGHFVALSGFVPRRSDPTDGMYSLFVKYGKLGEERAVEGNHHKKPLIMLKPGATFVKPADYAGYVGRMVENVAIGYTDAVQYGYGLTVEF